MNVLFITEITPFPLYGGERIRSHGLLKILETVFSRVVAVTGKSEIAIPGNHYKNIEFHEFDFKSILSKNKYVNCAKTFTRNKRLLEFIDGLLLNNKFDAVFVDYNFYGQYIPYFKSKGIPVIYGTHNVQSNISAQRPSKTLRDKISRPIETLAFYFHEHYYFRKADAIIAVSENDSLYYRQYMPLHKVFIIPNFLVEADYHVPEAVKEDYVIMAANFNAFQNMMGLEWFVGNIWTDPRFTNRELYIIGIGSDAIAKRSEKIQSFKNIKAFGSVEDIKPYISKAKVSVVPLLHGSGTRLKCIESMALKTQLLSTSKGAEGVEHEGSIETADEVPVFIERLSEILDGKIDKTEQAFKIFLEKYSMVPNIKIFRTILNQICDYPAKSDC
jgi:polysaccharide biosynthesis protein PslH